MKTNGNWARLDGGFHSHPKTLAVGNDGAGLLARAISYCGDHLTDGLVPNEWAKAAAPPKLRRKLVDFSLWKEVPGGYQLTDFLDYNPSRAEIEEERERKREAGLRGAEKRWGHGSSHSSSYGTPSGTTNSPGTAGRDATVRKKNEDQEQPPTQPNPLAKGPAHTNGTSPDHRDETSGVAGLGGGIELIGGTIREQLDKLGRPQDEEPF